MLIRLAASVLSTYYVRIGVMSYAGVPDYDVTHSALLLLARIATEDRRRTIGTPYGATGKRERSLQRRHATGEGIISARYETPG